MTAVSALNATDQPAADEPPPSLELTQMLTTTTMSTNGLDDDERNSLKRKHKRRNREERRKRSRSFSSDDGSCSSVGSKKKKKRKKRQKRRSLDEPPSPKVNPIFLWVKEDNAKIVEVRCEDYDRRNRIKLTKTAGGWRATPHVEIKQWRPSDSELATTIRTTDDSENESSSAPKLEPEPPLGSNVYSAGRDDLKSDTPPPPLLVSYQDDAVDYRNDDRRFELDDVAHTPQTFADKNDEDSRNVERLPFDTKLLNNDPKISAPPVIVEIEDSDDDDVVRVPDDVETQNSHPDDSARQPDKFGTQMDESEDVTQLVDLVSPEMTESDDTTRLSDQVQTEINESDDVTRRSDPVPAGMNESDDVARPSDQVQTEISESDDVTQLVDLVSPSTNESSEDVAQLDQVRLPINESDVIRLSDSNDDSSNTTIPFNEHAAEEPNTQSIENVNSDDGLPVLESQNIIRTLETTENYEPPSEAIINDKKDNQVNSVRADSSDDPDVKLTTTHAIDEKSVPLHQNDDPDDALRLLQSENDVEVIRRPCDDVFSDIPDIDDKTQTTKLDDDKQECVIKCCEEAPSTTVDENHNNEFESDSRSSCMMEPSNFCADVLEMLGAMDDNSMAKEDQNDVDETRRQMTILDERAASSPKNVVEYDHSALMTELEEMMNERLKQESVKPPPVLDDIYNFVPSPSLQSKSKEARPTSKIERVIEAVKAKSAKANALKSKESTTTVKSDLDNLDLLWRLPEGTTIHQSKPPDKEAELPAPIGKFDPAISTTISLVKPSTPIVTSSPLVVDPCPVQVEPLNLGKPRRQSPQSVLTPPSVLPQLLKKEATPSCKIETKPSTDNLDLSQSKLGKSATPDASKHTEPLAQLKEIMSDPDVTVPDPLLVPKERLSALIANPKKEIPRLMALTNEVKYPKVDTNMLEVSLAHLQLLLQSSKKEDELKLFQKHADILQSHLKNDSSTLDPATMSALNQMLWFPYLSHLDVGRGAARQDLVGMMNMMYPYNAWAQPPHYDYPHQSHLMNFWPDARSKTGVHLNGVHSAKNYADLYKSLPPSMTPSLYTSAPSVDPSSRVLPSPSFPSVPRNVKHQTSRRHRSSSAASHQQHSTALAHVTASSLPPSLHPPSSTNLFKPPPHFDLSHWPLPQTSDSQHRLALKNSSPFNASPSSTTALSTISYRPPVSSSSTAVASASEHSPKLKVRKFDVDPNAVPKLINKNLTAPALAPLAAMTRQVPSQYYGANHLWNPLYAPPESREGDYSSGHWNWTTPVTVSGK